MRAIQGTVYLGPFLILHLRPEVEEEEEEEVEEDEEEEDLEDAESM